MSGPPWTPEHEAFRRAVRSFLEREVAPHADDWEAAGRIPREVFRRMGDLGFLGITAPEAHGGAGADVFMAVAFLEELPRSRMGGFCASVSVQQFMATAHIAAAGSEALKRRYLEPSVQGAKVGALAITEPDAGSDVASIRTRAVREGDAYVVNGSKTFITNGAEGDFYTLAVRTGGEGAEGISLLVVDADTPGVTVSRRLKKMGWHASDTAELAFQDARVPAENLVGEEGQGFGLLVGAFALERLCAAAIAVGSADLALEETLAYMKSRTAFGRPLTRFQALTHRLADLAAELEAARHLTHHCAGLVGEGRPAVAEAAMAKLVATELSVRMADACLQCYGGYGFMEEYPLARFFRDARAATLAGGTSEIMREIVARSLVERAGEKEHLPAPAAPPSRRSEPAMDPSEKPAAESPPSAEAWTVERIARSLPGRLRADKVEGWKSVFHYRLKNSERPDWTVRIENGACTVEEGLGGAPDCIVEMKEETFLAIETGKMNPQTAFLMGRVRVTNLTEMMQFIKAFRPLEG
ncbi:MAG: acyl-CoA dehydrogenase family protein [Acidobacteriota bacterium]